MTLEMILKNETEEIMIWRFGVNDYSAEFINAECSVRGTLKEIMEEISENYDLAELEEVSEEIVKEREKEFLEEE